jgi:hypothetical protein
MILPRKGEYILATRKQAMARPTRDDGIVPPEELKSTMKVFTVVGPTIRDSLGAYCAAGQQAALTKADATKYHKMNLIQVALPDFGEEKKDDLGEPASGEGQQAAAVAGKAGGEAGKEPAADSAGAGTARRV